MEKHYAQALWKMIEKGIAPKKAVDSLYEHLNMRGRGALMPRIAKAFERLSARENQISTVTLSVAHEKDAAAAKRETKVLLERLGADAKDVEVRLDGSLIGGWRLEGKEALVDASYKKYLLDMYNAATTGIANV